jgi:hypothetical protein
MQSVTTDCINEHLEKTMTEAEAYGQVIDMIVEDRLDYKKIALALAKRAPKVLLGIVGDVGPSSVTTFASEDAFFERVLHEAHERIKVATLTHLATGNKVGAIKALRELTGWGLKEAKDYCDYFGTGAQPPHLSGYANTAWLNNIAVQLRAKKLAQPSARETSDEDMDALLKDLTTAMSTDPEDRYEEGGKFA